MYCLGTKHNGLSVTTTAWDQESEIVKILRSHLELEHDYCFLQGDTCRKLIDALMTALHIRVELTTRNDLSAGMNFRWMHYNSKVLNKEISIDRIRHEQQEIIDLDILVMIFREALQDEYSFYNYYIPERVYNKYFSFCVSLKNSPYISSADLDKQSIDELRSFDLIAAENERYAVTHKLKSLFFKS